MKEYIKQLADAEKYMKSGDQTLLTPEVFEISSKFEGETFEKA